MAQPVTRRRRVVRIPGLGAVPLRPDITPRDVVKALVELRADVDAAKNPKPKRSGPPRKGAP